MSHHILFVDDEAPIRELLSVFFRKRGYEVTTAMTSDEAIARMDSTPYQLVILDVDIAGENGLDLLGRFKSKNPGLPVIMFTGMGYDENLLNEAMSKGADGFMSKTASLEDLLKEVQGKLPAA